MKKLMNEGILYFFITFWKNCGTERTCPLPPQALHRGKWKFLGDPRQNLETKTSERGQVNFWNLHFGPTRKFPDFGKFANFANFGKNRKKGVKNERTVWKEPPKKCQKWSIFDDFLQIFGKSRKKFLPNFAKLSKICLEKYNKTCNAMPWFYCFLRKIFVKFFGIFGNPEICKILQIRTQKQANRVGSRKSGGRKFSEISENFLSF